MFIAPAQYLLGIVALESEQGIKKRLSRVAGVLGEDVDDLFEKIGVGAQRRYGSRDLLEKSGRDVISGARRYGARRVDAHIASRCGEGKHHVQITYPHGSFSGDRGLMLPEEIRCSCPDQFYDDVKSLDAMCGHAATLEVAMAADNATRRDVTSNLTGMYPRKRAQIALPFTSKGVGEVLVARFIEGKGLYEINKNLLEKEETYSEELERFLAGERDLGFRVKRLGLKHVSKEKLSCDVAKMLQHYRGVLGRATKALLERGYFRDGYGLEFKGSEWEVVARRFRRGDQVYSLCCQEDMPPVIVEKRLGRPFFNGLSSQDTHMDSPYKRSGQIYECVDDLTRREAWTQVIIPGQRRDSLAWVAGDLNREYQRRCV